MPTKEERAAINRANAKKSTGPRTQEGKDRSRRNAIKHGGRAEALRLMVPPHTACHANEDRQSFYDSFDLNVGKYRPNDEKEVMLVREITDYEWEIDRNQILITAIHNAELMRQVGTLIPSHPDLADIEIAVATESALAGNLTIRTLQKRTRDLRREISVIEKRLFALKKHCPSPSPKLASTAEDKTENWLNLKDEDGGTAPNEAISRQPNSTPMAIYQAIFGDPEPRYGSQ
jgi:hypothetical protein